MREIKFRAWNGEQMVSPDYITRKGEAVWKENSIVCVEEKNVMQFTGIKDKNGKEIWEGDILKIWAYGRHRHYVVEDTGRYYFEWGLVEIPVRSIAGFRLILGGSSEVISNRYESPELMEG